MTWTPGQFIVVAIAGWMNRQQQEVIEYLKEENRVLREELGHKRIILNDARTPLISWRTAGPRPVTPSRAATRVLSPHGGAVANSCG
jgi:hypothetical protein